MSFWRSVVNECSDEASAANRKQAWTKANLVALFEKAALTMATAKPDARRRLLVRVAGACIAALFQGDERAASIEGPEP